MVAAGVPYAPPKRRGKLELFHQLREMQKRGEDLSVSALKKRDDHLYDAVRTGMITCT